MRILSAVAELAPHITTGGLGNAVAGLNAALTRAGHDVTTVIPGYADLELDGPDESFAAVAPGVEAYLDSVAFGRPGVYGPEPGTGYDDNWLRYGRFARAVADQAEGFDVLHLHDAHVAPAAMLCDTPAVLTIHNAAHQLGGPLAGSLEALGRPGSSTLGITLEWFGAANFLKAGMVTARRITTVSPTHATDLAGDRWSFGLGPLVRALPLPITGILNGIDVVDWDPTNDERLPARFSNKSPGRRAASRRLLLDETGLDDGVLFGNVGRLAHQKGLSLVEYYLGGLVEEGFRLVLIGRGELDEMAASWVSRYPGAVARLDYDPDLARVAFAGADIYLMPSEYEPSGLGQMYAMRYGCPPLAYPTGGLADTVIDIDEDPDLGNGFVFRTFNAEDFAKTVRRAMRYRESIPKLWRRLQERGMTTDWSWDRRVPQYEKVFADAVDG